MINATDIGRWLSRDPMNEARRIAGTNLYTYCTDNPVIDVDPLGLHEFTVDRFHPRLSHFELLADVGNDINHVWHHLFPPETPFPQLIFYNVCPGKSVPVWARSSLGADDPKLIEIHGNNVYVDVHSLFDRWGRMEHLLDPDYADFMANSWIVVHCCDKCPARK
jgi:hypothetical protein